MNRARGFTLAELLVAALIMLVAATGALTLLAQGRRAQRDSESTERLRDSADAALDLLSRELRLAGFSGLQAPGTAVTGATAAGNAPPAGLEVAGGCLPSLALDLGRPITGADGEYAAAPGLPLSCRPGPGARWVEGSDTLVLRRAATSPTTPQAGRLQWANRRSGGRLFADGLPGPAPVQVNDLEVSVFYVSADSTAASGLPSLRRKRLVGGSRAAFQDEELVSGVEDMQVEALTDGSNLAFQPLAAVPVGVKLRRVRLWLLVRSDLPEQGGWRRPELRYANRIWPAATVAHRQVLAQVEVEPRNLVGLP